MKKKLPVVYFYISPHKQIPADRFVFRKEYDVSMGITDGEYCHILQTYWELKDRDYPCVLTDSVPKEGIVIFHNDSYNPCIKPGRRLLLIYVRADKPPIPNSQLNVVPNKFLERNEKTYGLWKNYYIPHWLQPNLIPRDKSRGNRFKNIAYIGTRGNLCKELKNKIFEDTLKSLGLHFYIIPLEKWNDFSNIDAILSVRFFKGFSSKYIINKTPQKLFNAWAGHVPAILDSDKCYKEERKSKLDYIQVETFQETIEAIKLLQKNPELRRLMSENGKIRSQELSSEKICDKWQLFLNEIAIPEYYIWSNMSDFRRYCWIKCRFLIWKLSLICAKLIGKQYVDSSMTHKNG